MHYIFLIDVIFKYFLLGRIDITVWKLENKWMVTDLENLRKLKSKAAGEKTENQPIPLQNPEKAWE